MIHLQLAEMRRNMVWKEDPVLKERREQAKRMKHGSKEEH